MNVESYFGNGGGRFLKTSDIGEPLVVTIAGCAEGEIGHEGQRKLILSFRDLEKELPLNQANLKNLVRLFGKESDLWIGKSVEVYVDRTISYAGHEGGLRLRLPSGLRFRAPSAPAAATDSPF